MKVDVRTVIAIAAVALALFQALDRGAPAPPPAPSSGLVLAGKFVGPTASDDAVAIAGMCFELADKLELDGREPSPKIVSGQAWDDLRTAVRSSRMRGVSIGERQPHARDAIHKYLDTAVGTAGGPMGEDVRVKWVNAYREIARAAEDASR